MILPTTNLAALLLLIVSMVCLGTWANTKKLAGNWRVELYYYDFAVGALLCAVIAAFTLGSFNSQDLTFQDEFLIAGRRQMAWAFAAGMVFNLANMLLLAAMQVSGMAVAFPIAYGLALAIGAITTYFATAGANVLLLFSGAVLALIAVAVAAYTHGSYSEVAAAPLKPVRPEPRAPRPPKRASPATAVALGLISGVVLSLGVPVLGWARDGEGAVSSYGLALLFGGGMLLATIILTPFFMTFPVQGSPISIKAYFTGTRAQHLWGLLGGAIFMAGLVAAYAASTVPVNVQPDPPVVSALAQGATMLAALCGLLVWREFKTAPERSKVLLAGMLILLGTSIGVVAIAPLYVR